MTERRMSAADSENHDQTSVVASITGSAAGVCLRLFRGLQLWVKRESGEQSATGLAHYATGWDLQLSAGRHDQPEAGLYLERNANSALEWEQQFVDQDRQLWQRSTAALDGLSANRGAVVDRGGKHERVVGDAVFGLESNRRMWCSAGFGASIALHSRHPS